jgi:hypothetical protein
MLRDESGGSEGTWCGVESESAHAEHCARLHRRLKRIVKARAALDAQEAEALREAERLRVWRHYGYGSLLEYLEMEAGYTPREALERLRVARAIVDLPAIADAMAQGELSFSAGRELTRVATADTEQQWLEAAADKNVRDVEDMVSGRKRGDRPTDPADPKLRTRPQRFDDIDDETRAMVRQARQILERELGERMSDRQLLRAFARTVIDGARAPDRTHAPYQMATMTCEQCKRGWQDGAGITVEMSPAAVETALCDAQHIGSVDAGSSTSGPLDAGAPTAATRAKSDIPPALRRKIRARDHGKCRVPWCRSARNIDLHHIVPRSEGGEHTLENILLLCESHHLAHHAGALIIAGTATSATFTRRAHHAFAIAERAVETASALKALGFDRHEVKAAMEKTRTHVGTAELTLEQWIKIALGFCPKPR